MDTVKVKLVSLFRKSLTVIAGAALFLTTAAYFSDSVLADIFVGYDETLATLTVRGFRFFSFSFLLNGFCMYGSAFFTALNNGFISFSDLSPPVRCFSNHRRYSTSSMARHGRHLAFRFHRQAARIFVTVSFWIACRKEYHYA
ncbi:MAG: hypothetical protein ACLRZN_03570 [Dialister invisus]